MKAGHSSVLGSNENIGVSLNFETDNVRVLQEPLKIYDRILQITFRQGKQLYKANNVAQSKKKKAETS